MDSDETEHTKHIDAGGSGVNSSLTQIIIVTLLLYYGFNYETLSQKSVADDAIAVGYTFCAEYNFQCGSLGFLFNCAPDATRLLTRLAVVYASYSVLNVTAVDSHAASFLFGNVSDFFAMLAGNGDVLVVQSTVDIATAAQAMFRSNSTVDTSQGVEQLLPVAFDVRATITAAMTADQLWPVNLQCWSKLNSMRQNVGNAVVGPHMHAIARPLILFVNIILCVGMLVTLVPTYAIGSTYLGGAAAAFSAFFATVSSLIFFGLYIQPPPDGGALSVLFGLCFVSILWLGWNIWHFRICLHANAREKAKLAAYYKEGHALRVHQDSGAALGHSDGSEETEKDGSDDDTSAPLKTAREEPAHTQEQHEQHAV